MKGFQKTYRNSCYEKEKSCTNAFVLRQNHLLFLVPGVFRSTFVSDFCSSYWCSNVSIFQLDGRCCLHLCGLPVRNHPSHPHSDPGPRDSKLLLFLRPLKHGSCRCRLPFNFLSWALPTIPEFKVTPSHITGQEIPHTDKQGCFKVNHGKWNTNVGSLWCQNFWNPCTSRVFKQFIDTMITGNYTWISKFFCTWNSARVALSLFKIFAKIW